MTTTDSANFTRILPVEGGLNLRDMGGYATGDGRRVKTGAIYRSGQMAKLSDAGTQHMIALGIRSVVDFRRDHECAAQPTTWHMGSDTDYWTCGHDVLSGELAQLVISGAATAEAMHAAMISLYRALPRQHAGSYRHLFDRLAAGHIPLLFNCAAGKDRTGVAAALILHALGVPRETLLADYLMTNEADLSGTVSPASHYRALPQSALDRLIAADADYLNAMFAELDAAYGGTDEYLDQALGVDEAKRGLLREHLLEQ